MLDFIDQMQEVITAIPMRFSSLSSEVIDDQEYQNLVKTEFIYNRYDASHRLISKSFRYQLTLDTLGLEKSLWIEEVHRRFNILSLFNFAFRECQLSFYQDEATEV